MAGEHANVLYNTQIGIQNTQDTGVAANVLLRSFSIAAKPVNPTEMLTATGSKIDTDMVGVIGAMTNGKIDGWASFPDLVYLYSLLCKAATITTPVGATLARDWVWLLKARVGETPKFATVENIISSVYASRFVNGNLTGLKCDFDGNRAPRVSADMIGWRMAEEGVTPTGTPTEIAAVPVSPSFIDVFVADTLAGLSTGRLGALYKHSWELSDRRGPVWPQRSDKQSWAGVTEGANKCMYHLEMEQDGQSDLMMRQARRWSTRFIRFLVSGPQIEAGMNYEWEITMPFKVNNPDRGPQDKVYGGMYDLSAVDDPNLGGTGASGFCMIRLRTALTSLVASTDLASGQQPDALITANP